MANLAMLGQQLSTDWKLCILCQVNAVTKGALVLHPRNDSYQHLLDSIKERSSLHDGDYVRIYQRLNTCTAETLLMKNAMWHRSCYSEATNKAHIQRARDRRSYEHSTGSFSAKMRGQKRTSTEMGEQSASETAVPFTRSATVPLDKDLCFFCQKTSDEQLYSIRTENAGRTLREAVEKSDDLLLKTRLNCCIAPCDAHAMDLKYHKQCWTERVFRVLRRTTTTEDKMDEVSMQRACLIELINLVDIQTRHKEYLPMEDIETTYINMLGSPEALEKHKPSYRRQWLKDKILSELPGVVSVHQKNRRKSSVLYSPKACNETLVQSALTLEEEEMNNMKHIYMAAKVLRKTIAAFIKEPSDGSSDNLPITSSDSDVPAELYTMIRWIMVGPVDKLETEKRTRVVDRSALTLSQNIVYGFKTTRQVQYKPKAESAAFRSSHSRVNPQARGLALTVHHDTRNKTLIELLNAQGYCVPYTHVLHLETAIANAVVENTKLSGGLYVPTFLKKGIFPFFAADNSDFNEDTPDGKGTTHGTIIAVYQRATPNGETLSPPLKIQEAKSLTVAAYHVPIIQCNKPKPQIVKRDNEFAVNNDGIPGTYQLTHLGWVVASVLTRTNEGGIGCKIPGWAGFNSLISSAQPLTNVGALPLLPEVAHDWSTLLTVLINVNQLRYMAVGDAHPTIITFDLALYEKVVQLLDARPELKNKVVPRLGELHVVMAALRAIGACVENSGIDDAWMEADVYGSATTRQILKCSHYKRALRAHIYSYMALYELALDEFFKENPQLKEVCLKAAQELEDACAQEDKTTKVASVRQASTHLEDVISTNNVVNTFESWVEKRSKDAMFKATMNYLRHVEAVLFFVAASRNADMELHLAAGELLSKLFFSMDRIKYKRLWPRYISDMHDLKTKYPETWKEFVGGSLSVSKNDIPFTSIGADHACEHLNRQMKVKSGLVGISNNPNARQRFFLATPELSRMSVEYKAQFFIEATNQLTEHHDLGQSEVKREHSAVDRIKAAILAHGNPFAIEGDRLYNMITLAYVPDEYVQQILNASDTGQKLYEDYVAERINGDTSLWAKVTKERNKMFMSGNKRTTIKLRDKTVDLKETKDLYGRLMVLAKSSRDIDQKDAIGNHEFTLTPRALFAPNGSMLRCTDKSKLIQLLEEIGKEGNRDHDQLQSDEGGQGRESPMDEETIDTLPSECAEARRKIAVVDGMVLVQKMKKSTTTETVRDLSHGYNELLMSMTRDYDEIILVFDTYKDSSLKHATREARRHGQAPVQYQINDDTRIKHISMKRFLSHDKTKADLTDYLATKVLQYNQESSKLIISSSSGHTRSNGNLAFQDNNHEEADTLLIHQAVLASRRNPPDAQIMIFSPDTDVLVLVIANYHLLLEHTQVSMVSGNVDVWPIARALGCQKAKALPALHSFSGADNVGKFNRVGKATWLKAFLKAENEVVDALQQLLEEDQVSEQQLTALASFVCDVYSPKGIQISSIPELRWYLFCKHMAESDRLPPTMGALKQHVLRVHIQARVWGQASIAHQEFMDPLLNGFCKDDNDNNLMPHTTDELPAPKAIIEMITCHCKGDCSSQRCSCRSHNLACTDLCLCSTECQNDDDSHGIPDDSTDEDDI